jgi:uncharacterized protein
MTDKLSASEILNLLKLEPNATCGFVRLTFVSDQPIAAGASAAAICRSTARGLCALFHGNAYRPGATAPHPQ